MTAAALRITTAPTAAARARRTRRRATAACIVASAPGGELRPGGSSCERDSEHHDTEGEDRDEQQSRPRRALDLDHDRIRRIEPGLDPGRHALARGVDREVVRE